MSLAGYSSFDHMAAALFLDPSDLVLAATPEPLTLYCDASGKETDPLFCVGGALATVERWTKFNKDLRGVLDSAGVEYFHMVEFAHSTGQFKDGWKGNDLRRNSLMTDLSHVINECVQFWAGICVFRREYDKANQIYRLDEFFQPYSLCGVTCIEVAHKWQIVNRLDDLPIKYVFEEGDNHWGQLTGLRSSLGKHQYRNRNDPRRCK